MKYCPWDQIPRDRQSSSLKLKYGKLYTPPPATGTVFADMTNPSYYATSGRSRRIKRGSSLMWDERRQAKDLPKDLVSRGLAAYMIVRAKNLTMP